MIFSKKLNILFLLVLLNANQAYACLVGVAPLPPPSPDGIYRWGAEDTVLYGIVSSVEKNLNLNWIERKLVDLKIMNNSTPGAATPLHKVELKNVRYFIGTSTKVISFELSGCGMPIPKSGERAIFFIMGKGEYRNIVPLYESDERFVEWLKILEKIDEKN